MLTKVKGVGTGFWYAEANGVFSLKLHCYVFFIVVVLLSFSFVLGVICCWGKFGAGPKRFHCVFLCLFYVEFELQL